MRKPGVGLGALSAFLVLVGGAAAVTVNGTIDAGDPTMTGGRLNRDGVASTCAAPKSNPGTISAGTLHYDSYTFSNSSGSPECVTASLTQTSGTGQLFTAAYLGSFNPTNAATNYLADSGSSPSLTLPTTTYSFRLAAGQTAVIVVHDIGCLGCNYTLSYDAVTVTPAIHIVKLVNGQDANSPSGPHVPVGSTVTFTYVVTNTGNVPVASVAVTDDRLGPVTSFTGDTNGNSLLDLTETWTYTQTAIALAGEQTNVGTATGQDASPPNTVVNDTDPANYFGDAPGIQIVKFVNGQDANSPPGPVVPAGSTITFTYVVTNTGNVPLANVVVTDDKLGAITSFTGDTNGNSLLDLTETWTYTQTAIALAGQQTNVGTATGQDANTVTPVTDNDPANYISSPSAVTMSSFAARPVAHGVLLRWRTGTEVDVLGFQVYRSRGHSWQRITPSLIAAKGSVSGASYRHLDRTAKRGVSYRYRIKAMRSDGTATWFGPVRVT